jgi:hypothetical protein
MANKINKGGQEGGKEGAEESGQDGLDVDEEPLFDDELTHQARAQSTCVAKDIIAHTEDDTKLINEAWMK